MGSWYGTGYKSYDYYDMVMTKNVPQYHINAKCDGGSEKTNYYLSVAHTGQDAMMRDFKYERTNLQLNIDTKITDRFTIGAQISGKYEKTEDVGLPGGDGYYSAICLCSKCNRLKVLMLMIIRSISIMYMRMVTIRQLLAVILPAIKII